MERSIVCVQPARVGWALSASDGIELWYPDELGAILAADCIALSRYERTGLPTGVKVRTGRGDWVLMSLHGSLALGA